MKRVIIAFILAAGSGFCLFPQTREPADVILLLDSSSGMVPFYGELNDYITGVFLREYLRPGDTFHLIRFSDKPRLDISRRVRSRSDAEIVIGRIFLHDLPVQQAGIHAALDYAENFISTLPARPKRIVLVSGGASSGFSGRQAETQAKFARQNASFEHVGLTGSREWEAGNRDRGSGIGDRGLGTGDRGSGIGDIRNREQGSGTRLQGTGVGEQVRGGDVIGNQPERGGIPVYVETVPPEDYIQEEEIGEEEFLGYELPEQESSENDFFEQEIYEEEAVTEPLQITAVSDAPPGQLIAGTAGAINLLKWLVPLAVIVAVFCMAAVFKKKANPGYVSSGTDLLVMNLFVEDQNSFIGRRNTHALKNGCSYTVGGKNSDFTIFIVPFPERIAEIRRDGNNCTFIPVIPRYFPDLGSDELKNCAGKTIRVVSDKNYELKIKFICESARKN